MNACFFPLQQSRELSIWRWSTRLLTRLVLLALLTGMAAGQNAGYGRSLKIMTRNLYQGTDFQEALLSNDMQSFLENVTLTLNNVDATNPEARMMAIAQEVAKERPDILAVQEATVFLTGTDPFHLVPKYNLLELLAGSLAQLGTPYAPVNVIPQFQFAAPSSTGEWVGTVTVIAILVRADVLGTDLQVIDQQGGLFPSDHTLSFFIAPMDLNLAVSRGWACIDATFQERKFRFITAHPEAWAWQYGALQIADLLPGPANTTMPVILAADFNSNAEAALSDPRRTGYSEMLTAGFADSWPTSYPSASGFTCCQKNDLTNAKSQLDQRIDLIMTRGFTAAETKVVGDNVSDRVDGLWPSDHAGVVTKLRFQ